MDYKRNTDCWYAQVCHNDCPGCIRYLEMQHLFQSSGIPNSRKFPDKLKPSAIDIDAFNLLADIKSNIQQFVERGCNLFIGSLHTGNGKTSWAIKLMLRYFDSVWAGNGLRVRGLFIHVPTILNQLKDFNNPLDVSFIELLKTCDLVIFDDIAGTELSKYDYNQLLPIIEARIEGNKSCIFTSNCIDINSLSQMVGFKLSSRILGNKTTLIILKGADYRGKSSNTK